MSLILEKIEVNLMKLLVKPLENHLIYNKKDFVNFLTKIFSI